MPQFDEEGLVIPRKPLNPCIESPERKSLHKEMLWNQRIGKNVLDQKNELEKVMAKRKDDMKKKEIEAEKLSRRSSLERRLEEQQLKLKMQESSDHESNASLLNDKESACSSNPQSEFLKIYSKVKSATINDVSNNNNNNNNNINKITLKNEIMDKSGPSLASKT